MPYKCKYCGIVKMSENLMSKPLENEKCKECKKQEIRLFGRELNL